MYKGIQIKIHINERLQYTFMRQLRKQKYYAKEKKEMKKKKKITSLG